MQSRNPICYPRLLVFAYQIGLLLIYHTSAASQGIDVSNIPPIDDIELAVHPKYPDAITSPDDGSTIFFAAVFNIEDCSEADITLKFGIKDGRVTELIDSHGNVLKEAEVKRDGTRSYLLINGERSTLVCEQILLGITQSGVAWAYSEERGVFHPEPKMMTKLWEWLRNDPRRPPWMSNERHPSIQYDKQDINSNSR